MSPELASSIVQIDNDQVKVTEWRFPPGGETGVHRHTMDYVVIPLSAGHLIVKTDAGESRNDLAPGKSYFRSGGQTHNVINPASNDEFVFVEVEIKPGRGN